MYLMAHPDFIGIVGSRRRATLTDRKIVFRLVEWLAGRGPFTIVSGGCPDGADAFAEEAAGIFGLEKLIHNIDRTGADSRWEFTKRAYARNRKIVESSDEIYCLVHPDRKGGTENTIQHARDLRKRIFLVESDGSVYLSPDGETKPCEPVVRLLDLRSTD